MNEINYPRKAGSLRGTLESMPTVLFTLGIHLTPSQHQKLDEYISKTLARIEIESSMTNDEYINATKEIFSNLSLLNE